MPITIGYLASGESVTDRPVSHIKPELMDFMPAVLARISSESRDYIDEEVFFDGVVGESICVETVEEDEIVWAYRKDRAGYTRFVKNREPEPSLCVTVLLKKGRLYGYVLITAFIGPKAEPEPWDKKATGNSLPFWMSHALVWDENIIVPNSETSHCPW